MSLLRTCLLVILAIVITPPASAAGPGTEPALPTSSDLIRTIGLDHVFVQFGRSIATSPRHHGIADPEFLDLWEASTTSAFADAALSERLAESLSRTLTGPELLAIESFLGSPLGQRITGLEQANQQIPAERQLAALARGQTLYWAVSPRRKAQFDELLTLSGADMTFAIIGESLRGMALGLHLSSAGDIETPWQEIDAAVQRELGGMRASLLDAAHAAMAHTYDALSDGELEAYLEFLRTPGARKFYDTATFAIGDIIRDTMFGLGRSVAVGLRRVDI